MTTRLLILSSAIVFLLLGFIDAKAVRGQKGDKSRCSNWNLGICENLNKGTCGRGTRKDTRTGEGCTPLERTESCKVACPGDKKVCKYRKGTFSDCDDITSKKIRIDTLMTELSDPSCEPTKKMEKICKKKCTFGPWTEGECKDGKMTLTRPIKSGGDECKGKTTKVKRCGSGGGGRRRGGGNNGK